MSETIFTNSLRTVWPLPETNYLLHDIAYFILFFVLVYFVQIYFLFSILFNILEIKLKRKVFLKINHDCCFNHSLDIALSTKMY